MQKIIRALLERLLTKIQEELTPDRLIDRSDEAKRIVEFLKASGYDPVLLVEVTIAAVPKPRTSFQERLTPHDQRFLRSLRISYTGD